MLRHIFLSSLLVGGGYYAFSDAGGYSRVVNRTPEQVAMGLADLDITDQPGAPGTSAARAGGITPLFKRERTKDGIVWKVMSGSDVATSMIAHLTPIDGGKRTRVTASVERGNAPDDFVSPAFRSEGITMGLFAMALEDELNELTAPMAADPAKCEELLQQFTNSNLATSDLHHKNGLGDAIGDTAKTAMRMHAFNAEYRRQGCKHAGFSSDPSVDNDGWGPGGDPDFNNDGWPDRR